MKNIKLFLLLAFFLFSWGWSDLSKEDSFYYAPSETNAPDTIYVIEGEIAPTHYSEANSKWLIYVHPTSLLYSVLNKSFLGYVTLEKELTNKFSFLVLPSFISHEIEVGKDSYDLNVYDYYSWDIKINQFKIGGGFRLYSKGEHRGFYLQLDADVFIGRTKSISSEVTEKSTTYVGASITSSVGFAFKYKSFAWFMDTGVGLQANSLNYYNYDDSEQLMILDLNEGLTTKLNFALGFYLD